MYVSTWDHIINNEGHVEYVNKKYFDRDVTLKNHKEIVRSTSVQNFKNHFNEYIIKFFAVKFTFIEVFGQVDNIIKYQILKGINRKSVKVSSYGRYLNKDERRKNF